MLTWMCGIEMDCVQSSLEVCCRLSCLLVNMYSNSVSWRRCSCFFHLTTMSCRLRLPSNGIFVHPQLHNYHHPTGSGGMTFGDDCKRPVNSVVVVVLLLVNTDMFNFMGVIVGKSGIRWIVFTVSHKKSWRERERDLCVWVTEWIELFFL